MLAVAKEGALVPSAWRCRNRPTGIQVHVSDHNHADCERGSIGFSVAAAALNLVAMRVA
jgi:hypothetical protein